MSRDADFRKIAELEEKGEPFALATLVKTSSHTPNKPGSRMIVMQDSSIFGTIGGGALEKNVIRDALYSIRKNTSASFSYDLSSAARAEGKRGRTGMICGGRAQVFIQVFTGKKTHLLIMGGGHIAMSLGPMARLAGIRFTVVDNRREFASKKRFPGAARVVCAAYGRAFSRVDVTPSTFVVIVTHAHTGDRTCLEQAMRSPARYIGMIGSRRKVGITFDALKKKGLFPGKDPRVYAPVGLDIGDHSPQEIAVSILAQIIKVTSSGTGKDLRKRG